MTSSIWVQLIDLIKREIKKDPNFTFLYLKTAFEDEDPRVYHLAFQNVVEAFGGKYVWKSKKKKSGKIKIITTKNTKELAKALGLTEKELKPRIKKRGSK